MANRLVEAAEVMQTSHLAPRLQERIRELERINEEHREENGKLREVIRQQGELIMSMKEMICDFVYGEDASLGRLRRGGR